MTDEKEERRSGLEKIASALLEDHINDGRKCLRLTAIICNRKWLRAWIRVMALCTSPCLKQTTIIGDSCAKEKRIGAMLRLAQPVNTGSPSIQINRVRCEESENVTGCRKPWQYNNNGENEKQPQKVNEVNGS
ncbi:hypothetical protein KIN20_037148 [Parelaphostrongylus tenuis]|uniref:Uncharacterized protein n=1 Tax=Parelaphostrongylus tenuis TaxID=148309 RepID=A0AAD5RHE7_PARTN|nr:hypothetical protein KIN20_037148 [Parelaphostrongylus tenuis]